MNTYKEEFKEIAEDLDIELDTLLEDADISSSEFESQDYRFIHDDEIDQIMCDELADEYMLGCFKASFLVGILDWPTEAIECVQEAEKYEVIGRAIIEGGHISYLQQEYVSADGYGHHFAHYDGHGHEFWIGGQMWHAFKVN